VPSHSILPEARRAAIEAAFDEALAEVRAADDVALLQECRAIFRKRVPFNLRAYVAAALVLKGASAARPSDRHGRNAEAGRDKRESRQNGDQRKESHSPKEAQPSSVAKKAEKPRKEPPVREERTGRATAENGEDREPRDTRENRYRGEGVTLFVSAGRRQRFYARIAIKILLELPGVTEERIGDIRTMDNYSFIVVDPVVEDAIVAALNGYDFKGRTLAANRARKRGESAPVSGDESLASDSDSGLADLDAFGGGSDDDADDADDAVPVADDFGEPEPDGDATENA